MMFWKTFLNQDGDQIGDDLLASVRAQLTHLLNSEAPLYPIANVFRETLHSNFRYGLDSLHTVSSQMDQDQFARQLEGWIRTFEPRLTNVAVEVVEGDASRNVITFSVMAKVKTDTGEHALLFDSSLNLGDQKVQMEGQEIV